VTPAGPFLILGDAVLKSVGGASCAPRSRYRRVWLEPCRDGALDRGRVAEEGVVGQTLERMPAAL
jgi:hypothetical protein